MDTIKRKLIAYHPGTCQVIFKGEKLPQYIKKNKELWIFHSNSEFLLFELLRDYCLKYNLQLNRQINFKCGIDFNWKIDFSIKGLSNSIANRLELIPYNNTIYIEFKGKFDENFRKKQNYIFENLNILNRSLLLVSNQTCSYGYHSKTLNKFFTKPVYSLALLKTILK
jgi:hypothetical protein